MKKKNNLLSLLSALLLLSIFLGGCEKQNETADLSPLTKEVIQKPTIQEMRQGQAMLSTKERSDLWSQKLAFILNNPNEKFTNEQKLIIDEIKGLLESNGMTALIANPSIGTKFLNANLDRFSRSFNKAQLFMLIESPFVSRNLVISTLNDSNLYGVMNNKYAGGGGTCSCLYDMGCPGAGNDCNKSSGCKTDDNEEMCGVFGTSSCKGTCTGYDPVND